VDVNENAKRAAESIAQTRAITEAEQTATLRHAILVAVTEGKVQTIELGDGGHPRRVEFFPDIRPALIAAAGQTTGPADAATDVDADGQK
jgi:hypothetical protein